MCIGIINQVTIVHSEDDRNIKSAPGIFFESFSSFRAVSQLRYAIVTLIDYAASRYQPSFGVDE